MPHLEFPNLSHKESYLTMMKEWRELGEEIIPGRLVGGEEDFESFIETLEREKTDNPNGVNAHLFFLVERRFGANEMSRRVENGEILGAVQIRHHVNHPNLIETGGHIGYGIRPSQRGKGYATEQLKLGLLEAQKIGLDKVMIACYEENLGSRKVIEKNGGVFERHAEQDGRKKRRYWITLV